MLSENGLKTLVGRLATEQGYTEIDEKTFADVPFTVEDYANAVLKTEGLFYGVGGPYFRDVCRVVSEVFEKYQRTD
jgi:hypothetical protein